MTNNIGSLHRVPKLPFTIDKLVFLVCLVFAMYFGYERYALSQAEQADTSVLVLSPQIGDIYFLDFRQFSHDVNSKNSNPKNKFKLAKVVRVTEENVAFVYGQFFYQWQYAVVNSIKHGDLSNPDYFEPIPQYVSRNDITQMKANNAIYLIKRPLGNRLYGNFINPNF